MAIRLIYHTAESMAGGISPFDAEISRMVKGLEIRIACPYLGLTYLTRILSQVKSWKLLTDVEEWLSSYNSGSRNRIVNFITAKPEQVHHCPDLHAKVLIAETTAIAGSANFTKKG